MDIYDDMLRSVGFSEINESAGISKSEFRSHKFFAIFGKYFRLFIFTGYYSLCLTKLNFD